MSHQDDSAGSAPHPGIDLARDFWELAPTVSWVVAPDGRRLHLDGADPGRGLAPAGAGDGWLEEVARRCGASHEAPPARRFVTIPAPDGTRHHFLSLHFRYAASDGATHVAGIAIDVTQHREWVDNLAHATVMDDAMGLYNRQGFVLFGEYDYRAALRRGVRCAIVCAAVDAGGADGRNEGGDGLRAAMARVLRGVFRETDLVARLRPDEFAVLVTQVDGTPEALVQRLRDELASHAVGGAALAARVGAAVSDPRDGGSFTDLLGDALSALKADAWR